MLFTSPLPHHIFSGSKILGLSQITTKNTTLQLRENLYSVLVEIHLEVQRWVKFLELYVLISEPLHYTDKFTMPRHKLLSVSTVSAAVESIIPYLVDTRSSSHIYFDGWHGLAASAVLRAIAEDPPLSLKKKFDKILDIDCSRWKSRRALQRAIADKLKLPQKTMAAFDRQDEEDDFDGVDEETRGEVIAVGRQIYQILENLSCLVIFHNGSDNMIDLADCGIPSWKKVLWTFRGRLRLNLEIKEKVDSSHVYIYVPLSWWFDGATARLILEEAKEVVSYIQHNKQSIISPDIAARCISYLLWLNKKGGGTMDYNWATHASNYWVCDGIIADGQLDESWEVSAALHQQIRLEDCSSHTVNFRDDHYTEYWKSVVYTADNKETTDINVSPELTSFFLTTKILLMLHHEMFQQSERLRVLKLSGCNFSFYSPPFRCCRNLRFLGLDHCKDQRLEEEDMLGRPIMEFFRSLWVLDMSHMDWELDLSQDTLEKMAANIREVHIKKGRIWRSNLAWRRLQYLRKLQVIEPTSSWETGKKDEFTDLVKLELLDLSGNSTIQVLPGMSTTTALKTLVLDGCVGLKQVGPGGLPPSLVSFSFVVGSSPKDAAEISSINLAGCLHLENFLLRGAFPMLEEVDLSHTAIKMMGLSKMVEVQSLKRILLVGCEQLCSIIWPEEGMGPLKLLCIDTRGEADTVRNASNDSSLVSLEQQEYCHAFISITDRGFLQSLLKSPFLWGAANQKFYFYMSSSTGRDGRSIPKKGSRTTAGQMTGPSLITKSSCSYTDAAAVGKITSDHNDKSTASTAQLQPLGRHIEIAEGVSAEGIRRILYVMGTAAQSLHVHDNCSITTVIDRYMMFGDVLGELETIWAADLLMACSICSNYDLGYHPNFFAKLRIIHLHLCPRLQFVLPLSWNSTLFSLETLHIVCCGDLKHVFPVAANFLDRIATRHPNGMLEFPKLEHLYLHHLSSLKQICEAKMFAPKLETVHLRGCWALRRLPATDRGRRDGRLVTVDCEKDWWEKLEWDGLDVGHHPSLFAPRHSAYYKKQLLRTTVLR